MNPDDTIRVLDVQTGPSPRSNQRQPRSLTNYVEWGCDFGPNWSRGRMVIATGELHVAGGGGRTYTVGVDRRVADLPSSGSADVYYALASADVDTGDLLVQSSAPSGYDAVLRIGHVDVDAQSYDDTLADDPEVSARMVDTEKSRSDQGYIKSDNKSISNGTALENMNFTPDTIYSQTFPENIFADSMTNGLEIGRERFYSNSLLTTSNKVARHQVTGETVSPSISGGEIVFNNGTGATSEEYFNVPYQSKGPHGTVAIRVENLSATASGSSHSDPAVGFVKDSNNYVVMRARRTFNDFTLRARKDGNSEVELGVGGSHPDTPFNMILHMCGDRWVGFYTENGAWKKVTSKFTDDGVGNPDIDFRDDAVRENWLPSWGYLVDDSEEVSISDFRSALIGQFAIRDPNPVIYSDTAPYIQNGKLYLTATAGDDTAFKGNFSAIWTLDVNSYEMEMVGALFFRTPDNNAKVTSDFPVQLTYDESADEWIISTSWDDSSSHPSISTSPVWVTRTESSPLHGVSVHSVERANLPVNPALDQIIYYSGDGKWHCLYADGSSNDIRLAETTDETLTGGWSNIKTYNGGPSTVEGPRISKVDGDLVVTCADKNATTRASILNYEDFTRSADVPLSTVPADTGLPPHVPIVPIYADGKTKYVAMAHDGETSKFGFAKGGANGEMWVFEADVTANGYEFAERSVYR